MRDISGDLKGRAERLRQQIGAENARFENLLLQLKTKRESTLAHLRAQLRLAHKLLEFTSWHDRLRAELAARIAAAEAAETLIRTSSARDSESERPLPPASPCNGSRPERPLPRLRQPKQS